jgi:two-component system, chemotaxis family, protein-glutamate methylesterase/glutaminase
MRVLITDDSIIMRSIIKEVLSGEDFEIVGEAGNGKLALELNRRLDPDLIIMDINMPTMNGLEATKAIMEEKPVPIVIFSNEIDTSLSFQALQYGAMEVIRKPDIDAFNDPRFLQDFLDTLRAMGRNSPPGTSGRAVQSRTLTAAASPMLERRGFDAVVMGASTGGPIAVREVLKALPGDFPLGIALVQHIEERFVTGYASWLDEETALKVEIAGERDRFEAGRVKVAPGNRHLICRDGALAHDDGPKVGNQKPSVDRLFETAADCHGRRLIGVLLTGMGSDGGAGCAKIVQSGGYTLVQNEESSLIYGMPKAAVHNGGASKVLDLEQIASSLVKLAGGHG